MKRGESAASRENTAMSFLACRFLCLAFFAILTRACRKHRAVKEVADLVSVEMDEEEVAVNVLVGRSPEDDGLGVGVGWANLQTVVAHPFSCNEALL